MMLRGDSCEIEPKLTPLMAFRICGKDAFRFTDILEEETFRLRLKMIARKEKGKENPGKKHLPLEELVINFSLGLNQRINFSPN